ncbi:hypothetical protein tb265_40950 [Gemmatimonadetes bacterium T265]|nr:hypothetical protein tb265_40950 [Gemmatimonadetes bacterium T265]
MEQAALALFREQGFAGTTVPQIAARAGLTTRTFFRHFADKREVLFAGEADLPALAARLVADAPAALGPMAVVARGLDAAAARVGAGRVEDLRVRRAVVAADEGLRERELRKFAALADAGAQAFRGRGVDARTATLAAELAVLAFRVAVTRWLDDGGARGLPEVVADTLGALRAVAADGAAQRAGSPTAASRRSTPATSEAAPRPRTARPRGPRTPDPAGHA